MRHPSSRYTRALIVACGASLSVLLGCAALHETPRDNAAEITGKVLVRFPLSVATIGISERVIDQAYHNAYGGGQSGGGGGCDAACVAVLSGALSRPTAPTYPVYQPTYSPVYVPPVQPVVQPRSCTSYPVGNSVQTYCW